MRWNIFFLMSLVSVSLWAQPKIRFDNPVYDFGPSDQFEDVNHFFVFRNVGNEVLVIEKLDSC